MNIAKIAPTSSADNEELFKSGPINKRECRDLICCAMFIAACISCIYFFSIGMDNG